MPRKKLWQKWFVFNLIYIGYLKLNLWRKRREIRKLEAELKEAGIAGSDWVMVDVEEVSPDDPMYVVPDDLRVSKVERTID